MDDMEREALRRAERIRSAVPNSQRVHKPSAKPSVKPPVRTDEKVPEKQEQSKKAEPPKREVKEKPMDFLFKDKETTLILLLIIFLYDEDTDPMLIMALIYLML